MYDSSYCPRADFLNSYKEMNLEVTIPLPSGRWTSGNVCLLLEVGVAVWRAYFGV